MSSDLARHRDNVPAARALRTRHTPAAATRWEALRGRRLAGFTFRRQHPIGPFVADFCCPDRRLIVERDGVAHATQRECDHERKDLLRVAGYRGLRFANASIRDDLPTVLETIRAAVAHEPPAPAPPLSRTAGW